MTEGPLSIFQRGDERTGSVEEPRQGEMKRRRRRRRDCEEEKCRQEGGEINVEKME